MKMHMNISPDDIRISFRVPRIEENLIRKVEKSLMENTVPIFKNDVPDLMVQEWYCDDECEFYFSSKVKRDARFIIEELFDGECYTAWDRLYAVGARVYSFEEAVMWCQERQVI